LKNASEFRNKYWSDTKTKPVNVITVLF